VWFSNNGKRALFRNLLDFSKSPAASCFWDSVLLVARAMLLGGNHIKCQFYALLVNLCKPIEWPHSHAERNLTFPGEQMKYMFENGLHEK
jgi:hypothetical protein